ncbi:MAG: hypothetical protein WCT49_00765 [Candidatus Paceibacterota bacterium]|nr:hypothetical protein [Candidatus Paceibacterota bacterium]
MKKLAFLFVVFIVSLLLSLTSFEADKPFVDEGGYIGVYIDLVENIKKTGEPLIIDYDCYSSCIIKLSAGNSLRVSKKARFGVHEARNIMPGRSYFDPTSRRNEMATMFLRANVPECAVRLFNSKKAFNKGEITFFGGEEILRACPQIKEFGR